MNLFKKQPQKIMETIDYKGYKITITQDECPESPREWSNLGIIAYKHSRYVLGDELINDPIEWLCEKLNLSELAINRIYKKYNYVDSDIFEYLEGRFLNKFIALPLYIYDHSGITINTRGFSCPWDSGKFGWIYTTNEKVKEMGLQKSSRGKLIEYMREEADVFDQYLRGDVYCYEIMDGNNKFIDSCCGFYGEETAISEAKDYIDNII
jgi:hypothetical protein